MTATKIIKNGAVFQIQWNLAGFFERTFLGWGSWQPWGFYIGSGCYRPVKFKTKELARKECRRLKRLGRFSYDGKAVTGFANTEGANA